MVSGALTSLGSVESGLATISVMASDKHTRIVYAFAMARKPINAKMILCGTQKTAKEIETTFHYLLPYYELIFVLIKSIKRIERRTVNQSICVKVAAMAARDHFFN